MIEKPQKIFRPLIDAIIKVLMEVFVENSKADQIVAKVLKSNSKWGARDRAFIAENSYEIIRNWLLAKYVVDIIEPKTATDFETILTAWVSQKNYEQDLRILPLLSKNDQEKIKKLWNEAQKIPNLKFSIPLWLDEIGLKELGETWYVEMEALHKTAELFIRVNTFKITKEKLLKLFEKKEIISFEVPGIENAIIFAKRYNLTSFEEFKKGYFEVQDAGSQMITELLNVESGMVVIDACAGAGGKTLQMAANMKNKGKIIALDVEDYKLEELKKRAKRNGFAIIQTQLIHQDTIKNLENAADALLLDVPCSGLGVLKRNPDSKWKLTHNFLDEIRITQTEILDNYSKMLKIGGMMVYATCSILKSENELQIQNFLNKNANFKLKKEKRVSPAEDGFDGFYMALIEKTA